MKTLRVIAIVLALGSLSGQAWGDISVFLEPSSMTIAPGDSLDVALKISGLGDGAAPSLGTFDLDVTYDPAILGFSAAAYGDPGLGDQLDVLGLGSFQQTTASLGSVNVFELSLDLPDDLDLLQYPEFILATLTFDALGAGTSPLGVSANSLGDSLGGALAAK